jgi:hypothetical protein
MFVDLTPPLFSDEKKDQLGISKRTKVIDIGGEQLNLV